MKRDSLKMWIYRSLKFKLMTRILPPLLIVSILGCAGTGRFQREMRQQVGELSYLYDSLKVENKKGETISIESFFVDNVLPASTNVEQINGTIYPFIIYSKWSFNFKSRLGYEQIKNDYKTFFKESLIEELKRSAKFRYVDNDSNIEVAVAITNITMTAPIYQNGFNFGGAHSETVLAGPVDTAITSEVAVKKDGYLLWKKEIQGSNEMSFLQNNYFNAETKYFRDYTTAMIESLSQTIKMLNENIVNDINKI